MNKTPIAVQLWSVREKCAKDFVGTLKKIAEMGYECAKRSWRTPAGQSGTTKG